MSRQLTVDKRAYQKRAHILKGRTKTPDQGGSRGGLAMEGRYLSKNNFQRLVAGAVQKIEQQQQQQGQQAQLDDPYVLFPRQNATREFMAAAENEQIGRWQVSYANHQHNLRQGDQVVVLLRSQTGGEGTCNEQGEPWRENSQQGPWWTPEYRVVLDTEFEGANSRFSIYDVPWFQNNNLQGGASGQTTARRRRRRTTAEGSSSSRAQANRQEQQANVEEVVNMKIIISFEQAVEPLAIPDTFNVRILDGGNTQVKRLTNRNKYGNEVKHWIGSGNTNGTYGLPALCGSEMPASFELPSFSMGFCPHFSAPVGPASPRPAPSPRGYARQPAPRSASSSATPSGARGARARRMPRSARPASECSTTCAAARMPRAGRSW